MLHDPNYQAVPCCPTLSWRWLKARTHARQLSWSTRVTTKPPMILTLAYDPRLRLSLDRSRFEKPYESLEKRWSRSRDSVTLFFNCTLLSRLPTRPSFIAKGIAWVDAGHLGKNSNTLALAMRGISIFLITSFFFIPVDFFYFWRIGVKEPVSLQLPA